VGTTNGKLLRYDETVNRDDTTAFKAFITSGAQAVQNNNLAIERAYTIASAESGVNLQQSLTRNTGDEANRTSTVSLTPLGSETTVLRKFEDAALTDAWSWQVTIGDAAAANTAWQVFQWRARISMGGEL
jgi:hypothetical protein